MNFNRHIVIASIVAISASAPVGAMPQRVQDLFIGTGTASTFQLSWRNITPLTEAVSINSVLAVRNIDYTINSNNGSITFNQPLPNRSAATVTYDYDTTYAHRASTPMTVPLSVDLAQSENSDVTFDATYKGYAGTDRTTPNALSMGLGGQWSVGNDTQLSTKFLYAPSSSTDQNQNQNGHSAFDQSGIVFGAHTAFGKLSKLSFGFSQAGLNVGDAAPTNGLTLGARIYSLGTHFDASSKLGIDADYSQIDHLKLSDGSATHTNIGMNFDATSNLHVKSHWSDSTDSRQHQSTNTDLSITADPTAGLHIQTDLSQAAAGHNAGQTAADIALSAKPNTKTSVDASYSTEDDIGSGEHHTLNLGASIVAAPTLTLNAQEHDSGQGGTAQATHLVGVALRPNADVDINAHISFRDLNQAQSTIATVSTVLRPASFLNVSGGYTKRSANSDDPNTLDAVDSSDAKLTVSPSHAVQVYGTYQQNPTQQDGLTQRQAQHGVGVEAKLGMLSVTGGYNWIDQYHQNGLGSQLQVGVGLQMASTTSLTGGYQENVNGLDGDRTASDQYSFGLKHDLGDRFNLSLDGTVSHPVDTVTTNGPQYSATANLGMKF